MRWMAQWFEEPATGIGGTAVGAIEKMTKNGVKSRQRKKRQDEKKRIDNRADPTKVGVPTASQAVFR